jgi:sensor c-di-GMP phosphodiesterase-like protein
MAKLPKLKVDPRTLRRALDGREFIPHFQPIVVLATGKKHRPAFGLPISLFT